jgi:hypothetical protein
VARALGAALTDASATQRAALARYASQQDVMPSFLAAFVCRHEPFTAFTTAEVQRLPEVLHQPLPPHPEAGGQR